MTISWSLAVMFGLAVAHKLRAPLEFVGIVRQYRVLPAWAAASAGWTVIGVEVVCVATLLVVPSAGLMIAVVVLVAYTGAVTVNLLRGRRQIDCGCGGEPTPLSGWLVVRNVVLIAIAAWGGAFATPSAIDGHAGWRIGLAVLGTLGVTLVYVTTNQLLANRGRYERLWQHHG